MPVHIPAGGVPPAWPMIISETPTHIIVAVEIAKTTLARHRRFLEMLLHAATLTSLANDE